MDELSKSLQKVADDFRRGIGFGDIDEICETAAARITALEDDLSSALGRIDAEQSVYSARINTLEAENAKLREALTPSASTKQAFIGEFTTYQFTGMDDDGNEVWGEVLIPWTSIKDIMKAIYDRATLSQIDKPPSAN